MSDETTGGGKGYTPISPTVAWHTKCGKCGWEGAGRYCLACAERAAALEGHVQHIADRAAVLLSGSEHYGDWQHPENHRAAVRSAVALETEARRQLSEAAEHGEVKP